MSKPIDKVYVITKGDYSDYHICAVTLDKNRAEKLRKMFSDHWNKAEIEEYTLDEEKTRRKYGVVFDVKGAFKRFCAEECDLHDDGFIDDWNDDDDGITIWVESADEAHALKIAQDRLAEYKAKKAGIV